MLKEYTQPVTKPIDGDKNVFTVLVERAERKPDEPLVSFTAAEFRDKVIALAKGLIARGVMPGDAVSIISSTSWQWAALDMAIMSIGSLTVPVYETNSPAQVATIFNDSQVTMAFAENDAQRDKIESVRSRCSTLKDVYVIDFGALNTLEEYGRGVSDEEFWERERLVKGDDLATIVYTSGSTGMPKGIELSHGNFVYVTYAGTQSMPDIAYGRDRRLLLFLPLAHAFARYMVLYCFAGDVELGLSNNLKTILSDFGEFKPSFILAVPRIFEKVYNAASQKAGAGLKGRLFAKAFDHFVQWSKDEMAGGHHSLGARIQHSFYMQTVGSSIRSALGPNMKWLACGGAPLNADLAHFFNGFDGITFIQGYGMTETAAPCLVNFQDANEVGSVGRPGCISIRLADDDELMIKGPNVFLGYYKQPQRTAEALTSDGWLHTGDLATIDDRGFVFITGRKKDIIITAGGKNISPAPMEDFINTCPIVAHAVVIGDGRPFIAALIELDAEIAEPRRRRADERDRDQRRGPSVGAAVHRQGQRQRLPRRVGAQVRYSGRGVQPGGRHSDTQHEGGPPESAAALRRRDRQHDLCSEERRKAAARHRQDPRHDRRDREAVFGKRQAGLRPGEGEDSLHEGRRSRIRQPRAGGQRGRRGIRQQRHQ